MKSKRLYNLDILTWIILIEITELLYNSLFNFYFIIADFTKLPSSLITPPPFALRSSTLIWNLIFFHLQLPIACGHWTFRSLMTTNT